MSTSNLTQDFPDLFGITTHGLSAHFVDDFDSPVAPAMYSRSSFSATGSPVVQPSGTVSPKDLMMDSSAPPSTSFTDLSTPSFESPALFSTDTSPLFADQDLGPGHEEWETLFPADSCAVPAEDMNGLLSKLSKSVAPASPMIRTSSSPGQSPEPGSGHRSVRHSSVSGVNPRRREKPLPPIVYDNSDPVAAKRARNTEAARKSRARKADRHEAMERHIAELEKQLAESREREAYWKSVAEARK